MDRLRQDVRYALRTLRREIGFSAVIVLTLAIGIGVNTAVFSVVRSVLLAPLPYPEADRLVMLWSDIPSRDVHEAASSYANVQDWRAENRVLDDLALFDGTTLTLTGGEFPERISGARASANLFSLLGAAPAVGRGFSPDEERSGAPVVVLGDALWRSRFGASPDAVGRSIDVGGVAYQVVGVMAAGFTFPGDDSQLWLPLGSDPGFAAGATGRGTGQWSVIGRLRDGVSAEGATREMSAIAERLERTYPQANAGLRVRAVPLRDQVTGASFRLALWTLFGAVGLVLLIACANGAHMILVRGMNRAREVALRVALGASTGRLVRQALTESMVMALLAGVVGVVLAVVGLRVLVALAPGNLPRLDEVRVDPAVLLYATGVSLVVGVIFGVAPALGFSRGPLAEALREGRSVSRRTSGWLARRVLIVLQFALAIVLVFGASQLVRSLIAAGEVELGFDPENVLMANLSVEAEGSRLSVYERAVQDVAAIPGVEAAGIVEELFVSGAPNRAVTVEGSAEAVLAEMRIDAVAGDAFRALGVPLREGRAFTPADGADAVPVAIVNETMARRFWPGQSPVGKRFRTPEVDAWVEVVGVVPDMRRGGPERAPIAQAFRPYAQAPSRNMILLARSDAPATALIGAIRARIAAIDRTVPLYAIGTVGEALDRYLLQRRFQTLLLGLFSAIALVLAAVGVYGLIQYSVSQRTREIGVRMALGGTSAQVVSMILRQGLALALTGLALGMGCALLLSHALAALLFGVGAADPVNILLTSALLLATTLVACWLPARRASRIDPMEALRAR